MIHGLLFNMGRFGFESFSDAKWDDDLTKGWYIDNNYLFHGDSVISMRGKKNPLYCDKVCKMNIEP